MFEDSKAVAREFMERSSALTMSIRSIVSWRPTSSITIRGKGDHQPARDGGRAPSLFWPLFQTCDVRSTT